MSFTSKFFGATSSSEEESNAEIEEKPKIVPSIAKKFLLDSSDDEDKKKRVVRSAESKKKEEYRNCTKKLKNSLKIKDFDSVLNEFEDLHKIINKYGDTELPLPVVKNLYEIEEAVRAFWDDKEAKSKLNKQKLKALTTLKQKLKKYNAEYVDQIEKCRTCADSFKSEFSDSGAEAAEDDFKQDFQAKKTEKKSAAHEFLKKEKTKEVVQKRERKVKSKASDKNIDQTNDLESNKNETQSNSILHQKNIQKSFNKALSIDFFNENIKSASSNQIIQKMFEIYRQRGKKISDKIILATFIEFKNLVDLTDINAAVKAKILLIIILMQVDMFSNDSALKYDQFKSIVSSFSNLLSLIKENPDVHIQPDISEDQENFTNPPYFISGNFIHYIFNIRDELNLILQNTDSYSLEYLSRMKDVLEFDQLVVLLQNYVELYGSETQICEIYMLRIEHAYYKLDQKWLISLTEQLSDLSIDGGNIKKDLCTDESFLDGLCRYLYAHGTENQKALAMMCQVYHHALHDRFSKGKQLFLRSQLQENIAQYDTNVKIMYNRALVQLGLCAFRKGFYLESYNALKDIQQSGMIKELLAQGLMRNIERTQKQEMKDRQKLLPFHMHVNLELVECAYLLSILVLEAAYSVSPIREVRNRFSGRGLVFLVRNFEKIPLSGPPESLRECLFAAYKSMRVGDWKGCVDNVKKIKCWKLLVNYNSVMEILVSKLKQQCLVAYLFVNCGVYTNIKISTLTEKFELNDCEVKALVNRMVVNDAFPAQWNEDSTVLHLHHNMLPNNLDMLCSTFIERLSSQIDQNNRLGEISSLIRSVKEKSRAYQIST